MKKILFTVAALGLGIGLAASVASAEMSFSASGKYNVTGMWINQGNDSSNGMLVSFYDDHEANDMFHHSLYVYPTLKVNDNTRVVGEMRFIDRAVWGTSDSETMRVYKLWMEYDSPVGTVHAGRLPAGTWGSKFLDSTSSASRFKWVTNFMPDPFSMTFIYQKSAENDAFSDATDERDQASYYAGIGHKADFGKTDLAFWHTRSDKDLGDWNNTEIWVNGAYSFAGINVVSELKYVFGDDPSDSTVDVSSWGAMVDASTKMDAFTLGGLFFYLEGDVDDDSDNKGYVGRNGVGNDFNPFLIATGDYFGVLNGDKSNFLASVGVPSGLTGNGDNPGAIALALYGVFQASEKLSFNGAVGHVWADEVPSGVDDKMGLEIDLGMSYKLLDNLVYSAQAGYLIPGDLIDDVLYPDSASEVIALVHSLTMTF
jgi:hypothetical protein